MNAVLWKCFFFFFFSFATFLYFLRFQKEYLSSGASPALAGFPYFLGALSASKVVVFGVLALNTP